MMDFSVAKLQFWCSQTLSDTFFMVPKIFKKLSCRCKILIWVTIGYVASIQACRLQKWPAQLPLPWTARKSCFLQCWPHRICRFDAEVPRKFKGPRSARRARQDAKMEESASHHVIMMDFGAAKLQFWCSQTFSDTFFMVPKICKKIVTPVQNFFEIPRTLQKIDRKRL